MRRFLAVILAGLATMTVVHPICAESTDRSKYLLLDDRIVKSTENAKLTVGKVVKSKENPLFGEDKPWEKRIDNGYPNVIYDEEDQLYKCWYFCFIIDQSAKGMTLQEKKTESYLPNADGQMRDEGVLYAYSKDGIKWEKPELGVVEFLGNSKNNIVARGPHGAGVFKDILDPDPTRRFKAVICLGDESRKTSTMRHHVMFSPDGVHWSNPIPCPETGLEGDSQNYSLWAPELGEYVCYTRLTNFGGPENVEADGATREVRQVGRMTSKDFIKWTKSELCMQGLDPNYQIYCMPVFRYGGTYIGLPVIYDIKADRVWTELAWSSDTINWNRIDPGTPLIGTSQKEGDYDWGCVYPACPVFLDDEIRLYYFGSDYTHMGWRQSYLCLATLRPDGFAGYEQESTDAPAVVTTRPVTADLAALSITADVQAGGSVSVTVVDEQGRQLARSKPVEDSVTNGKIIWEESDDTVRSGKSARLTFVLNNAKLYAFQTGN